MLTWKDASFVFLQDFNYELLIPESVTNKQLFKYSKVKKIHFKCVNIKP